jgi:hypothetical protein
MQNVERLKVFIALFLCFLIFIIASCSYPSGGDPVLDDGIMVTAPDAESGDYFGYSVSIDGDYAVVGAKYVDDPEVEVGAAYIFRRTGIKTWDTGTKVMASDAVQIDNFGWSVAISGDYVIVGAPYKNEQRGAAYIFHRTGPNTWDTGTKITSTDGSEVNDRFGYRVAISDDYAIAGAPLKDGGQGAAYIFHRTGPNTWDTGTKITAADKADGDNFGYSVAISGDYAIVGAYHEDGAGSNRGAAYIFHRTDTNTWDAGTKITATDPENLDYFGYSVAISGDYAIAGAHQEDGAGSDRGAAYIFHRTDTNTWDTGIKIKATDAADDDAFGCSVSIYGDYALVGARYNDGSGDIRGAAYKFQRTGTNTWNKGIKVISPSPKDQAFFGESVSISQTYAIIGAYYNDGIVAGSGAAYIY